MSKKFITGFGALLLTMSAAAQAETLSNADIIQLATIGLGDEAVIAKIKTSSGKYELTTDDLIKLKGAGVSGPIIAAMLEASKGGSVSANAESSVDSPDPLVPHPSGIYILADWLPEPKMAVLDPTTSNQTKTGGFLGYALTGGLASMSFKTVIPNASARVKSEKPRPSFYFYFDQAGRSLSKDGQSSAFWNSSSVTSPNEFSLVRFDVKKNSREAKVGNFNIGGAKSGVMDKDRISFSYETVATGVYKVTPDADLEGGEYGFLYSSSSGGGVGMAGVGAQTSKVFDFSIPDDSGGNGKKKK